MASFQAKICWKRLRKSENKNCFHSILTRGVIGNFKKMAKKFKKLKSIIVLHFKPKQYGNGQEGEKIKIIVSLRSFVTRYRKLKKNKKKIQKIPL